VRAGWCSCVDGAGAYSLRACPEDNEAPSRDLLAVGVIRADGIVALRPEDLSTAESERRTRRPKRL
jgi:hypothetical protein